jgi:cell division septation protein DedD
VQRVATRTSSSARRAERTSCAPARAKAIAQASPMPEEAPVIQTTQPAKREGLIVRLRSFRTADGGPARRRRGGPW